MRRILVGLALALTLVSPVAASDFDVCPNIEGYQSRVPGNYTVIIFPDGSGWVCVPKHPKG